MDTFRTHLDWTGAAQGATRDPSTFSRDLQVTDGVTTIAMSSAPQFHGDATKLNPEQLFVAAVSACHALTYLFLAARAGIAVTGYADNAEGTLSPVEGKVRMSRVVLHPQITLERAQDQAEAMALVERAQRGCFIGNSVLSAVEVQPVFLAAERHASAA